MFEIKRPSKTNTTFCFSNRCKFFAGKQMRYGKKLFINLKFMCAKCFIRANEFFLQIFCWLLPNGEIIHSIVVYISPIRHIKSNNSASHFIHSEFPIKILETSKTGYRNNKQIIDYSWSCVELDEQQTASGFSSLYMNSWPESLTWNVRKRLEIFQLEQVANMSECIGNHSVSKQRGSII